MMLADHWAQIAAVAFIAYLLISARRWFARGKNSQSSSKTSPPPEGLGLQSAAGVTESPWGRPPAPIVKRGEPDIEIPSAVVGTSRRQAAIKGRVFAGDALDLRKEDDNPADPLAIAVYTIQGDQIGYLRARLAADVRRYAHRGQVKATVTEVTGGVPGKPTCGVNILIEVWEADE